MPPEPSGFSRAKRKYELLETLGVRREGPAKRPGDSARSLHKDMHILNAHIGELLRAMDGLVPEDKGEGGGTLPEEVPAKPPFLSVRDLLAGMEDWAGKNVIIEGSLTFIGRGRGGERRHGFEDGTGRITAFGRKELAEGKGTLFAVAGRTSRGRQAFLEIKDFHPRPGT